MKFSDEAVLEWLKTNPVDDYKTLSAMQEFSVSPEQMARVTGMDLNAINSRIGGVVNDVYTNQYGRTAAEDEIANALLYLQGGGLVDKGVQNLNNTQEGYNYDTEDVIAAYRETFGRNPTQDEYVGALATLGIQNFDRSSLGESGKYTAATVAALESDPYAGRYAGYNPFDLPKDAANVSTNILGDKVQYISPITQRPVVASFTDGKLSLSDGMDVLTPQQIESAIGLATATGGLTSEARTTMMDSLKGAKTVDDLYAAFSAPKAVAALGADGLQVGVGQTEAAARESGFNGMDRDALNNVYKTVYAGAKPYTVNDTVGSGKTPTPVDIRTTINNAINSTQLGEQKGLDALSANTLPTFTNFGTFGAAGDEKLGAGSADYQSDLIKSLRTDDDSLKSNNTGVNKYGYFGTGSNSQAYGDLSSDLSAFDPKVFNQAAASANDVKDWNGYSAYRTNSLGAKSPIVSFEDWLAGGKLDGKAAVIPATTTTDVYGGIP